jgi:hypothetical protein
MRGGARGPHARRTLCTLSVRTRAPTKQMGLFSRLRPEAAAGGPRITLQLHEERLVAHVGWDGHHLGEAEPHELGVDHHIADPHIREQPPVTVARLHVHLEPHAPALDEPAIHVARLAAARFLASRGVMQLRRVHADVSNLLDAISQPNVDRVAVHDPDDDPLERRRRLAPRRRSSEQQRDEQRERPRHALTVSRGRIMCQRTDTVRTPPGQARPAIRRRSSCSRSSGRQGLVRKRSAPASRAPCSIAR